jgi:hypothetical protein
MRPRILGIGSIVALLALGALLGACAWGDQSGSRNIIAFDTLVADPQAYAGQYLCTEGVHVDGFEASGLGASTYEKDGTLQLSEPVIWLEGAEFQSREDCIQTDTSPPFEFCQVVVCGVFETGGGYGHGGAYAYQIRGREVSALPSPAATSGPVLATPRADNTASVQEPEGDSPHVEPPPAILEIAGQEQVSGIGSYCWTEPTGADTAVSLCADMAGIPTAEEPLVASSPFTATFRLAPEETPDELLLEVTHVTVKDELEEWPAGWRGWTFKEGERYNLPLELEPTIELSLEPGLYVLHLSGSWQAWGDASYGFLVEVPSPLPALVVDEYAIVAAEVDGPGHFEFADRLGEQILARIEGLRTHAAGQELARANAALAPFGYRLETRFDAEWDRTFYDLYREGGAEPMLAGLSQVWPVSVNASGTEFVFAAENAPSVLPLYLLVQTGSVEPWEADQSAYLPPAYVGDALARVTFTGFPTLTYQVELNHQSVYSGTAVAMGAYMPLRSFTAWDGHWALEVDDHLIVDGQDVGQGRGYDAVFGFSLIRGQPFYFFEQDGKVRISYGGRTLPNVYDRVFHNQCCEAAMHNVQTLSDVVLFHALWDGTWYFVEAGVYDGEMAGTYRYTAPEGWSFRYPMHWDRLDEGSGFVQDTTTGKTVTFASSATTQAELEGWLESEIDRKLAATEAENTLAEPLTIVQESSLTVYRYAILSRMEASETLLRTTVFFDGQRRYEFHAAIPPVAEEEYEAILDSFRPAPPMTGLVLQSEGLGAVY